MTILKTNMKNILVFDDDSDILFLYHHILVNAQTQVHTCRHCDDIMEEMQKYSPDLIIMDNSFPDGGGLIAIQKIKADPIFKNIPILFSSANSAIEQIAATAGANAFLGKPFNVNNLRRLVYDLLLYEI